jgi:hypothetical protein
VDDELANLRRPPSAAWFCAPPGALGLHRMGVRLWPVAVAVPAAVVTISYLAVAALDLTRLYGDASSAWAVVLGLG